MQQSLFTNALLLQDRFREIVEKAIEQYSPSAIFVGYSGGEDSATVVELAKRCDLTFTVLTIDTGIASKGHLARIYADIQNAELPLITYSGKGLQWYLDNVEKEGFGYTPYMHTLYYRNLKERAIEVCLREHKTHRFSCVLFLTGVRRNESNKRKNTPLVSKIGSRINVNPIAEFTTTDKRLILTDTTWWQSKITHDCLCNWTAQHTIDELPENTQSHIRSLNDKMKQLGLWGYGEKPQKHQLQLLNNDTNNELQEGDWCVNCRKLF